MMAFLLNPGTKKRRSKRRGSPCKAKIESWKYRFFGSKGAGKRVGRAIRKYQMKKRSSKRVGIGRARKLAAREYARRAKSAAVYAGPFHKHEGDNPGRRRRRRAKFSYNRRRRSRNYSTWVPEFKNPYWAPSYAMNPGIMAGFDISNWVEVGPVVAGGIANTLIVELIAGKLPATWAVGWRKLLVSAGTAGALSAVVGMIAPKYSKQVLMGALTDLGIRSANEYVVPQVKKLIGLAGFGDFSDYLTPADVAGARPLGDYLTPADAASARPLGYIGYNGNDAVIEGTATEELGML